VSMANSAIYSVLAAVLTRSSPPPSAARASSKVPALRSTSCKPLEGSGAVNQRPRLVARQLTNPFAASGFSSPGAPRAWARPWCVASNRAAPQLPLQHALCCLTAKRPTCWSRRISERFRACSKWSVAFSTNGTGSMSSSTMLAARKRSPEGTRRSQTDRIRRRDDLRDGEIEIDIGLKVNLENRDPVEGLCLHIFDAGYGGTD
jgi:hypothetical protein